MLKWIILFTTCILALLYPGAELLCWDTAGKQAGSWSEISCDGNSYSGKWTGYVTNDCRFIGYGVWKSVKGKLDPSNHTIAGTGIIRDECGPISMSGTFTSDSVSIQGSYKYGNGGGGSFSGCIQQ